MLLKQDPSTFQPAKLIPELERAVTKFKANKYDLVSFQRAYFCFAPQNTLKIWSNDVAFLFETYVAIIFDVDNICLKHIVATLIDVGSFFCTSVTCVWVPFLPFFCAFQLFFTIVHDKHWIIVCANLLYSSGMYLTQSIQKENNLLWRSKQITW